MIINIQAKVSQKSGVPTYQWNIMKSSGVRDDEISKFKDAQHWLYYFPPLSIVKLINEKKKKKKKKYNLFN